MFEEDAGPLGGNDSSDVLCDPFVVEGDGKEEDFSSFLGKYPELLKTSSEDPGLPLDIAQQTMAAEVAILFVREGQEWVLRSHRGFPKDFGSKPVPRAWQSLPTIVMQFGTALFSEDITKDRRFVGQMIRGLNVKSFAGVTIQRGEEVLGSLAFGSSLTDHFVGEKVEQLMFLSRLMAFLFSGSAQSPVTREASSPSPAPTEGETALSQSSSQALPDSPASLASPASQSSQAASSPVEKEAEDAVLETLLTQRGSGDQQGDFFLGVLKKILSQVGGDGGYFLRFQEEKKRLVLLSHFGVLPDRVKRLTETGLRSDESVLSPLVQDFQSVLLPPEALKATTHKELVGEDGLQAYMMAPIQCSGAFFGMVSVFSRTRSHTSAELGRLTQLAEALGGAVGGLKSFEQAGEDRQELILLNECSQALARHLHPDLLYSEVVAHLPKVIHASNAYLFIVDERRGSFVGVAASSPYGDVVRGMDLRMNLPHIVTLTARNRYPFAIENVLRDEKVGKKWQDHFQSKSLLSVPLIRKERVIGVLVLDDVRCFRRFTPQEIQKVVGLSHQIALAIENATAHHSALQHVERLQSASAAIFNLEEEEKRRVANEIKNGVDGPLSGLHADLKRLDQGSVDPEMKGTLAEMSKAVSSAQAEVQRLVSFLHPVGLNESGLVPTLRMYTENLAKKENIRIQLQVSGFEKRSSQKMELLFYRVVQQALTNVVQHAKAESVIVTLDRKESAATLCVTDDGIGFNVKRYFMSLPRGGVGILGMKERVELMGGTFFIDSAPGQGTRLSIKVPLVNKVPLVKRGPAPKGEDSPKGSRKTS